MKTALRTPTRYEAERIEAMMKLGCVACAVLGIPFVEVQCHHILDGTKRMGHWFSLPVCAGHHKGEFTALQRRLLVEVAEERGIKDSPLAAIHTGRKAFSKVYGTEKQLWIRVQQRLRLPAVWKTSKIMPRREHGNLHLVRPADSAGSPGVLESDYHHAMLSGDGRLGGQSQDVLESQWDSDELHGLVQPGVKKC